MFSLPGVPPGSSRNVGSGPIQSNVLSIISNSGSILKRNYWCFISYRHTDNQIEGRQWATWLHQQLETYEIPEELVGQKNKAGEEIPSRIFPVFRDEEELGAGSGLTDRIYEALDNTRVLVVLCSPRVIESPYVFEEIRYFKRIGKSQAVYAAVIDGDPGSRVIESGKCFPDSLQFEVDSEGKVHKDRSVEPLAADFRLPDGSQGWTSPEAYRQTIVESGEEIPRKTIDQRVASYQAELELAKLKLISGILKIPLGVLQKRDKAYQLRLEQKKARRLRRWLAVVMLLAMLAVAGGVLAWIERGKTQQSFSNSLLDQGSEMIASDRQSEGLASVAGSLKIWPGNRVSGDRIAIGTSRRKLMFPMRYLPPPPSGTFSFPPQDLEANLNYRIQEDRRYPFARFSTNFDGVDFYHPVAEGSVEAIRYSSEFSTPGSWQNSSSQVTPPGDGYSIGNDRVISLEEFETGGMLNSFLMRRGPDGEVARIRVNVSDWGGGKVKEMHALGMGAVSSDSKSLGIFGFLVDDTEDPNDARTWKSLNEQPSLHLVELETGKLLGSQGISGYENNFQKPQEDQDLHAVRFVDPYFVVHSSNFERPGWITEVFDCSNPEDIVHSIHNQLLPGMIDDFNRQSEEFLIRLPDGLLTFRMMDGPTWEKFSTDKIEPVYPGVVPDYSEGNEPSVIQVESQDGRWLAEASMSGQVNIFDRGRLERTFFLKLDPTVEGGVKLERMLFLPDSPYLIFGMGVISDFSFLWSGWDFQRGEEVFPPTYQRSEADWKLTGASGDGRHLLFETPGYGDGNSKTRMLLIPESNSSAAPVMGAFGELSAGVQWTANGLSPLDSSGYLKRKTELFSAVDTVSPELAERLRLWLQNIVEPGPRAKQE